MSIRTWLPQARLNAPLTTRRMPRFRSRIITPYLVPEQCRISLSQRCLMFQFFSRPLRKLCAKMTQGSFIIDGHQYVSFISLPSNIKNGPDIFAWLESVCFLSARRNHCCYFYSLFLLFISLFSILKNAVFVRRKISLLIDKQIL